MTSARAKSTQAERSQTFLNVDHLKDGLGKRTTRGAAIVMTAQILRMGIQLVTTFFLARLLIPSDFGVAALGFTVLALISLFTDLGMTSVTVQTKNLDQNTASALFFINVALGVVGLSALILASPLLVWIFGDEHIGPVVIGIAFVMPIGALGAQHQALLMRSMKWGVLQGLSLTSMAAGSTAAVLGAWLFDLGYWALVMQSIVSAVANVVGVWWLNPWRPSLVRNWSGVSKAVGTGVNFSGTMVLGFLHRQLDNLLIGWRWGSTELGYYARGYSLLMMPLNLVVGPLSSTMIPALSRLQDEPIRWRQAYLDALIVVTALGGGLAALLFGGASPIIKLVLGDGWQQSENVFSCLVLALLAATPMNTVSWIYISLGRSRRMLLWGVIGASVYATSFLVGLPFGSVGVALAYGIAQISAFIPCMWMATRETSVSLTDVLKATIPVMTATVAVGLTLRFVASQVDLLSGLVATGLGGIVYIGLFTLICWNWPPHRRVRDRIIEIFLKFKAQLNRSGQTNPLTVNTQPNSDEVKSRDPSTATSSPHQAPES